MQLCKYLNCFLKTHNKPLNQYCLYYFFFLPKKKVLKNGSSSGWVDLQKTQVKSRVNLFLFWIKKIKSGSGIFRVGSGQKILTRSAMSRVNLNSLNYPIIKITKIALKLENDQNTLKIL